MEHNKWNHRSSLGSLPLGFTTALRCTQANEYWCLGNALCLRGIGVLLEFLRPALGHPLAHPDFLGFRPEAPLERTKALRLLHQPQTLVPRILFFFDFLDLLLLMLHQLKEEFQLNIFPIKIFQK